MNAPNAVTLSASNRQWKVLLAGMALGTLASVLLAVTATAMGWWLAGFFILLIPLFILQMHPMANHVLLTAEGFELKVFFSTHAYRWSDIQSVFIGSVAGDRVLAFNFKDSYPRLKFIRAVTKRLSGFEGAFPVIGSHSPEDVLALVTKFKDAARDA